MLFIPVQKIWLYRTHFNGCRVFCLCFSSAIMSFDTNEDISNTSSWTEEWKA